MPSSLPSGGFPSAHAIVSTPLAPLLNVTASLASPPVNPGREARARCSVADKAQYASCHPGSLCPATHAEGPAARCRIAWASLQRAAPAHGDGAVVGGDSSVRRGFPTDNPGVLLVISVGSKTDLVEDEQESGDLEIVL